MFILTCSITVIIVCVFEHVQWRFVLNDRLAHGYAGMTSLARPQEDWCYEHAFYKKAGVRAPECYFTSYDPERENFCLIMEDMNSAGYTGGDQVRPCPIV
jgi:hypothetical protein